ncbi:SCA7, zinc-binding domain-containing protein [Choanephora cucurbitarum]|nr:SCA7, zinc-binding domain-containing protein [Choanephora cucurbitarum]
MNGLSWNHMKDSMQLDFEEDTMSEEGSPVTTRLDAKDMDVFGLMPMEEDIVVVKCTNCHRPLLPSKFKEHSESCIGNNLFLDEEEEEETKKKKKRVLSLEDELSIPTAKRPPSASLEKNEKKTLKKDKQKKTAKQKAPLDLDKQCGVIQGPNQTPCTRSLTCKSHSMSAKRAVEGRSQPYDVLLAAYQKKSIGRPNGKEVASKKKEIPTSTSSNGISSTAGKSIKNLKKFQSQSVSSPTANDMSNNSIHKPNSISMQAAEEAFVDSDEEVESVLQAFKFSKPMPLAQKSFFFTKRKRQCFRLRDILLDAITPKPLNDSKITSTETLDSRPNHLMQQRQQQQQQQQQHTNFGYALMNDNSLFVDSVNSFSL